MTAPAPYQKARYRYGADGFWHSGSIQGPRGGPPTLPTYARISGSALTSPGGTPPPPVDGFALGTTKPTAANTGIQPGVVLTTSNGDITVNTAGAVIENLDIFGKVIIQAANVTIRNCRIRGGVATSNVGLVTCFSAACTGARIEFCELRPDNPSVWWDGVIGHGYTAYRNHVYWTVDGFGAYLASGEGLDVGVQIQGNYVHDLSLISPDPNHSDNLTHSDGIQVQGGWSGQIVGNNIQGFWQPNNGTGWPGYDPAHNDPMNGAINPNATNFDYGQSTSCIICTPNQSSVQGWLVDRNWFDGGGIGINLPAPAHLAPTLNFGTISNNKFGHKQGLPYHSALTAENTWTIVQSTNQQATTSGNVYEDSGHPVQVR